MSAQLQVTGEAKIRDIQGPVVANSGVITALDGAASQYVRGDGTLADFPTSSGGGSSVSYYLNSSVSQGTIGGVAYRELSKDPIIGAGTDITISANGYVANYITDANDPDVTIVPGGNFNCEFYFSVNNNTGNPTTYAELYKYDGTTFTLLGTSAGVPESINQGTTIAPYYFAIPVATASLSVTDRLAIRIYVNVSGRTVTLHTENGHLCQVVTTLSKGMVSLNNLTDQSQYLATGTSGTNFAIVSSGDTHTFNLPVASAINTGKLSSTDWSTFNNKVPYTGAIANVDLGNFNFDANNISGAAIIAKLNGPASSPFVLKSGSSGYTIGDDAISLISSPNVANTLILASNIGVVTKTAQFGLGSLTTTRTYTLPDASGTIALTSDINYPVTSVFGRTGAVVAQSGDYTTTQVTEGTNLYYTDSRSRGALSFTAGSGAYNSSTGVITIPTNNNQITNGAGYITSSALSGYLPLTGGTLTGGLSGTTATFSGLGTFYQLTMTGATAGRIFYAQTGGVVSQSGNLNWNETNGMLGVGTPNPTAVITAFSNNAATQFKASGNAPAFTFSESLTTSTRACVFGLATAANQFITGTAAGDMAIANQSTTAGAIVFGTGTAEKMRMSPSGRLLVGTSVDSGALFQVAGAATFSSSVSARSGLTGTITAITTNDASGFGVGLGYVSGSYGYVTSQSASSPLVLAIDGGEKMRITTSGNVGIGTSSPTALLHLAVANASVDGTKGVKITNPAGTTVMLECGVSSDSFVGTTSASDFSIRTGNTERMRITSTGNVGIGTTAANRRFVVVASTSGSVAEIYNERNNGSGDFCFVTALGSNDANTSNYHYIASTGGADRCYIYGNGNIVNSNNSYGTLSDISLKENIIDATPKLADILQLKVRNFNLIGDESKQIGFIAQEFEEVFPSMVETDGKSDKKMIKTSVLTPMLVKGVQELKAEKDSEIAELRSQIEELKALIAAK